MKYSDRIIVDNINVGGQSDINEIHAIEFCHSASDLDVNDYKFPNWLNEKGSRHITYTVTAYNCAKIIIVTGLMVVLLIICPCTVYGKTHAQLTKRVCMSECVL